MRGFLYIPPKKSHVILDLKIFDVKSVFLLIFILTSRLISLACSLRYSVEL